MAPEPQVIVFSSPQCTHCERAKSLLDEQGITYDERNIGSSEQNRQDLLTRLPQARSLPQLFVNGVSIGSTEDLQQLIQQGRLEALLEESGSP